MTLLLIEDIRYNNKETTKPALKDPFSPFTFTPISPPNTHNFSFYPLSNKKCCLPPTLIAKLKKVTIE